MPTSSQALILQVNEGYLPPVFGRRIWRPAQSYQYPLSNININNRLYQSHNRSGLRHSHLRTESAHGVRTDLSTLPGLLRIQGLKGSLFYDRCGNSIHYDIESLPQTRYSDWTLSLKDGEFNHRNGDCRIARSNAAANGHIYPANSKVPHMKRRHEFVKMESTGEITYLNNDVHEEADFFKLVKIIQSETAQENEKNYFRLIKASPLHQGTFRLAKTNKNEVGAFYLVPPEGYESDDFRLLRSEYPGCYSILQANPWIPGSFKNLEPERVYGNEFKLVTAKPRSIHQPVPNRVCLEKNAEGNEIGYSSAAFAETEDTSTIVQSTNCCVDTRTDTYPERYGYFDDVIEQRETFDTCNSSRRKEFSLPDIMLSDPKKRLHNPMLVREEAYDFNSEEFRTKYLDSIQADSFEVREQLVELGFRSAPEDKEQIHLAKSNDSKSGSSSKLASCEWRTYNFDKWTRTTEAPLSQQPLLTVESARLLQPNTGRLNPKTAPSKSSLLEELKMNSNYKQWKKKRVTGIRMRKQLPPEDSKAVCLSLKDNAIPHDILLQQVQRETGGTLTGLQFDPVSVHSQESDAKSQWILRFRDESVCENLLNSGLCIMGTTYPVRRFNDVMKEEYDAYKFKIILQQIKDHKEVKGEKNKKSKKLKTMQTQTPL